MKKVYEKPMAQLEMFALSQSVAVNCGYSDDRYIGHPTHHSKSSCGWDDGTGEVYWASNPPCADAYPEDLVVGEVCYNNPNGATTVFSSV